MGSLEGNYLFLKCRLSVNIMEWPTAFIGQFYFSQWIAKAWPLSRISQQRKAYSWHIHIIQLLELSGIGSVKLTVSSAIFWMQNLVTFSLIMWMHGSPGTQNFHRVAASCSNISGSLLTTNFCRNTINSSTAVLSALLGIRPVQFVKIEEERKQIDDLGLEFIVFAQCRQYLGLYSQEREGNIFSLSICNLFTVHSCTYKRAYLSAFWIFFWPHCSECLDRSILYACIDLATASWHECSDSVTCT
jgi:hypothetical protein